MTPYDAFAAVYDRHFGAFAGRVLPALDRLLLAALPAGARVLDVCCGTGQLAAALAERGFTVTGVDESAGMLDHARRNAPAATFVRADARALDLPGGFDAAVSTFDAVNHLLTAADVRAVFAGVARSLRPGAAFAFDVNTEEGYRRRWHGRWAGDGWAIHAVYDAAAGLGRNEAVSPTGEPVVFVERCHSDEELRAALAAAGFGPVTVYDGHRDLGLVGEVGRAFYVARLPSPVDALRPGEAVRREAGAASRRVAAVDAVLAALPADAVAALTAAGVTWFIPGESVLGQVRAARGPVVYLAPALEGLPPATVELVAAHELAHVACGHRLDGLGDEAYAAQEAEARRTAAGWGYGV